MSSFPSARPSSFVSSRAPYSRKISSGFSSGSSYLDGVISSVCCDLDATQSDSYSGTGQTWANVIASPADGAGQTDYDFWLGNDGTATTNDPTFTGSAGDPAAYFSLDGGDYFQSKQTANIGPTLKDFHHKTGTGSNAWWIAMALNRAGGATAWGRGWSSQAANGMYLWNTNLYQNFTSEVSTAIGQPVTGVDKLLIISVEMESTTNNVRYWLNSSTATTTSFSWTTATDGDPGHAFAIGGSTATGGTVNGKLSSGSKVYHFSCGNEFLDDTKAAAIISHLNTRHGRTYISV